MKTLLKPVLTMKEQFFSEGRVLPKCININCERNVQVRDWAYWSLKTECGTCYKARMTGIMGKAMEGITIHKKKFCENIDGHLGWACPVASSDSWEELDMLSALDLEHVDGNHNNNDPNNVETICKLCHTKKSAIHNDCSNQKASARKFKIVK
jgi:hypothetical protein|tara:strand:- start:72 stop:530 length:459 start_codon:yes stop_codon:yes gene_type:complete